MDLTKDKFKELATPYCQNKNKKPKRYSDSYYEPFTNYLKYRNFELTEHNFSKYFLDFSEIHFEDNDGNRFDFEDKDKLELLKRSGGYCAICGTLTIFPLESDNIKALNIGAACHIRPASAYGPRSDINYRNNNKKEISSITNGIWACLNCHHEIDIDVKKYTVEHLKKIKDSHELFIMKICKNKTNIHKIIDNFEKMNDAGYIQIKKTDYENHESLKNNLLSLYQELKDVEKQTIKNSDVYSVIKGLIDKKHETFGSGEFNINIKGNKTEIFSETTTMPDINELKANLDNVFQCNNSKIDIIEYDNNSNKYAMVKNIENNKNKLEFFLINHDESQIIKIKTHDFWVDEINGFRRFGKQRQSDPKVFLHIQVKKLPNGNETWKIIENMGDLILKEMFAVINYLPDFISESVNLMIKYEKEIYTLKFNLWYK